MFSESLFTTNQFLIFFAIRHAIILMLIVQLLAISGIKNKRGNIWLACFFLCLLINVTNDNVFLRAINITDTRLLNRVLTLSFMLLPTTLYLSILFYVKPNSKLSEQKLYFLPCILHVISIMPSIVILDIKSRSDFWFWFTRLRIYFVDILFFALALIALIKVFKLLKFHGKNLTLHHSSKEGLSLNWIYYILASVPVFLIGHIFLDFSESQFVWEVGDVLIFISVFYVGFHIVKQKEIFPFKITDEIDEEKLLIESGMEQNIQINSGKVGNENSDEAKENYPLSIDSILVHAKDLENVMNENKPHLNFDLDLLELSSLINLRPQELSFLLNYHFKENFYAFINRYRIDESKKILLDPEKKHLNMVGVALESGYKSKSTFYKQFKEVTGLSPAEYAKS